MIGVISELRSQGRRVFVHCDMGESRSALVVVAYLMRSHNLTPAQTFDRVVARNPHADPNHRFLAGLDEWAAKWRRERRA